MKRLSVRVGIIAAVLGVVWGMAPPAGAVHLFPLFPGDPTGDCAADLSPDPETAAARVVVEGFFFIDESSGTSTTEIEVGESVTWEWLQYCHSVSSVSVPEGAEDFRTFGGEGSATGPVEGQDDLVKPEGDNNTFTLSFTVPGTYSYQCIHHAAVGMTGSVVVSESGEEATDEPSPAGAEDTTAGEVDTGVLAAPAATPATGGGAVGAGLALGGLALAGLLGLRRLSS